MTDSFYKIFLRNQLVLDYQIVIKISLAKEVKQIAKLDSKLIQVTYDELEIEASEKETFEKVAKLLNRKLLKFNIQEDEHEESEPKKVSFKYKFFKNTEHFTTQIK